MDSFQDQLPETMSKCENLYNASCKAYKDMQMANNKWKRWLAGYPLVSPPISEFYIGLSE